MQSIKPKRRGQVWKGKLKIVVDALIPQVADFEELLRQLEAAGYEFKRGKYISCHAPGQERFTRLKTLGADYTEEAITERIAGKRTRAVKAPRAEKKGVSLLIDIEIKRTCRKAGSFVRKERVIRPCG